MLETELRELFERQASADQPPSRISIPAASRSARMRLRQRGARTVATPVLAAGAVLAIVLIGVVPTATRPHPASAPAAPKYFNPLRPYAWFGSLPAGVTVDTANSGRTVEVLDATPGRDGYGDWILAVYAAGQCRLAYMRLQCAGFSAPSPKLPGPKLSQAPDVGGRKAYWTASQRAPIGTLAFQYARGGWASLDFYREHRADALRIARHISLGAATAPMRFPVQLTGMPGWQLRSAGLSTTSSAGLSNTSSGYLAVGHLGLASGAAVDAAGPFDPVNVDVVKARGNPESQCPRFVSGSPKTTKTTVAGYPVTINQFADGPGWTGLCAANADGLTVNIGVAGKNTVAEAIAVFAHLRLLGPNPAKWTTDPVG